MEEMALLVVRGALIPLGAEVQVALSKEVAEMELVVTSVRETVAAELMKDLVEEIQVVMAALQVVVEGEAVVVAGALAAVLAAQAPAAR